MYVLVKALGRREQAWEEVDTSTITLSQLHSLYDELRIELSNPAITGTMELLLSDVKVQTAHLQLTISDWLTSIGNITLPTAIEVSSLDNIKTVKYYNVLNAGYAVNHTNITHHPDVKLSREKCTDLILTKEGVDYATLGESFLFTVNGFIHPAVVREHGLYLLDGNRNSLIVNDTNLGMLDFRALGKLEIIPITDDMILSSNYNVRERMYIKTNVSFSDKTPLLVLGGILHVLDDAYSQLNDDTLSVNIKDYPLAQRALVARELLDYSEIPMTGGSSVALLPSVIASDESIRGLAENKHSFIVLVDAVDICVDTCILESAKLQGKYISDTTPTGLVLRHDGTLAEYSWFTDDEKVVITTTAPEPRNWNIDTVGDPDSMVRVDETVSTLNPYSPDIVYLKTIYVL